MSISTRQGSERAFALPILFFLRLEFFGRSALLRTVRDEGLASRRADESAAIKKPRMCDLSPHGAERSYCCLECRVYLCWGQLTNGFRNGQVLMVRSISIVTQRFQPRVETIFLRAVENFPHGLLAPSRSWELSPSPNRFMISVGRLHNFFNAFSNENEGCTAI